VLADKAYDANRIRTLIEEQGATPNISASSTTRDCRSRRKLISCWSNSLIATWVDRLASRGTTAVLAPGGAVSETRINDHISYSRSQ
jgi:transposase